MNKPAKAERLSRPLLGSGEVALSGTPESGSLDRLAKFIILALRRTAPPVIYLDAPLSYMSEGAAKRFYQGQGEVQNNATDPSVITYFVIQPQIESMEKHQLDRLFSQNAESPNKTLSSTQTGCRLVGIIPCSDAFGVDLLIDKYQAALRKSMVVEEEIEEEDFAEDKDDY